MQTPQIAPLIENLVARHLSVEHDLEMKNRIQTENLNTNYANLANIAKKTLKLRGFRLFRAFRVEKEIVLKRLLIISRLKTPCFGKIFLPRLTTVIPRIYSLIISSNFIV